MVKKFYCKKETFYNYDRKIEKIKLVTLLGQSRNSYLPIHFLWYLLLFFIMVQLPQSIVFLGPSQYSATVIQNWPRNNDKLYSRSGPPFSFFLAFAQAVHNCMAVSLRYMVCKFNLSSDLCCDFDLCDIVFSEGLCSFQH